MEKRIPKKRFGAKQTGMTKAETDDRELQLKIDMYGDMLFRLSFLRLQNQQDAEDVVQEVFYQYLKNPRYFESPEHEKAWFLKVALNACRKVWRSAWKRHQSTVQEESALEGRSATADMPEERDASFAFGPEDRLVRREENRQLLQAVMNLPEKYRDVIHLFYYEELSVREIARATGRGESTVTSQLTRGRQLLKKSLKEEYDFG